MKFKKITLGLCLCLITICFNNKAWAARSIPAGYIWKISSFDVLASTPPVQIYVEDFQGNITGADPSVGVDQYGIQGSFKGGIAKIPLSCVSQENNADENNVPDDHTGWNITFVDGGKQTYKIHLKGIMSAATTIYLSAIYDRHIGKPSIETQLLLLATPNISKEVDVTFDPIQNTITTKPILTDGDLLTDVKTACQLNLITSSAVCKRLEKKGAAIQDALEDKRQEKAEELINSFLRSLGELKGDDDNDKDDRNAIKEPALTILKEDVKALLASLEKGDHHDHGDHGHGDDRIDNR
jgi:hypothetical protein